MKIPTLDQLEQYQSLAQLGLLNFALVVILLKDIGFLYSLFSFALIFIIVSLVYHHVLRHGQPQGQQEPLNLFGQQLTEKFGSIRDGFTEKLKSLQQEHEDKKKNSMLVMLVVVYFCLTFVYDWMEAFIFLNFSFVYFFMPELFQRIRSFVRSVCNCQ